MRCQAAEIQSGADRTPSEQKPSVAAEKDAEKVAERAATEGVQETPQEDSTTSVKNAMRLDMIEKSMPKIGVLLAMLLSLTGSRSVVADSLRATLSGPYEWSPCYRYTNIPSQ